MRRARASALALVGFLLVAGCTAGGTLDELASATTPAGATATLFFRSDTRAVVELLSVGDSTMLVIHNDSVKSVEMNRLSRIRVHGLRSWSRPVDRAREQLASVSRFPHGLSAETLRAVLAHAGQTEPGSFE